MLIVAGLVVAFVTTYFRDDWMHGSWESANLVITFNTEDDTFMLVNGETFLFGTFTADKNSFRLVEEEGTIYTYRYERVNYNKIKVMFMQGEETLRVTLKRLAEPEDDFLSEDESLVE